MNIQGNINRIKDNKSMLLDFNNMVSKGKITNKDYIKSVKVLEEDIIKCLDKIKALVFGNE